MPQRCFDRLEQTPMVNNQHESVRSLPDPFPGNLPMYVSNYANPGQINQLEALSQEFRRPSDLEGTNEWSKITACMVRQVLSELSIVVVLHPIQL